jgi:hypothetical protein
MKSRLKKTNPPRMKSLTLSREKKDGIHFKKKKV